MRHVPEKYFKSRDSTKVKQMSRTVCGGGPGERGTINREVVLRELLGAQQTSATGVRDAAPGMGMLLSPVTECCVNAVRQLLNVQGCRCAELQAPCQLLRGNLASRALRVNCSAAQQESRGGAARARLKQAHSTRPPLQDAVLVQGGHNVCRNVGESGSTRPNHAAPEGHAPARRS